MRISSISRYLASAGELMRDAEVTRMFAQADESSGNAEGSATSPSRGEYRSPAAGRDSPHATREFTVANARESVCVHALIIVLR